MICRPSGPSPTFSYISRIERINALRSHRDEFGDNAPVWLQHLPKFVEVIADVASDLPKAARLACRGLLDQIDNLSRHLDALNAQTADLGKEGKTSQSLQTMPPSRAANMGCRAAGVGPITALAIKAFAPAMVGACRRGVPEGTWLGKLMRRKPRILVAIALANKMARQIWAMLTKTQSYRDPALAAA